MKVFVPLICFINLSEFTKAFCKTSISENQINAHSIAVISILTMCIQYLPFLADNVDNDCDDNNAVGLLGDV